MLVQQLYLLATIKFYAKLDAKNNLKLKIRLNFGAKKTSCEQEPFIFVGF